MSRERWLRSKRTADAKVLRWKVPGLYLRNSKEANRARQNEENRENSRKWSWRCSMGLDGSRLPSSVEMLGSPHGVRQGVTRGQGSDTTGLAMSRVSFTAALRAYWWGDKGESRESLRESSIHEGGMNGVGAVGVVRIWSELQKEECCHRQGCFAFNLMPLARLAVGLATQSSCRPKGILAAPYLLIYPQGNFLLGRIKQFLFPLPGTVLCFPASPSYAFAYWRQHSSYAHSISMSISSCATSGEWKTPDEDRKRGEMGGWPACGLVLVWPWSSGCQPYSVPWKSVLETGLSITVPRPQSAIIVHHFGNFS